MVSWNYKCTKLGGKMTSLEIISAKKNIEDYLDTLKMPKEVVRMVLKEIYAKAEREAFEEALKEAQEREKEDGENS